MDSVALPDRLATLALSAFAAPIRQHAAEWAAGTLAAIDVDLRADRTLSFHDELALVVAAEEWASARPELGLPHGALPWAKAVWCEAFTGALAAAVEQRTAERLPKLDALMRAYFGSLDLRRASRFSGEATP